MFFNIQKILLIFILFSSFAFSQFNLLNASVPEEVGKINRNDIEKKNDLKLENPFVLERDILWSKIVWEVIDLKQKRNHHLYYPIDTLSVGPDRRCLYDVMMKNISKGNITEVYVKSHFNEKLTYEEITDVLSKIDTLDAGREQYNAGEQISPEYIVESKITAADIKEFRIKGIWFFDKRRSMLRYRILGIAPASRDVNFKDDDTQPLVELFWIWYPNARNSLHAAKVFNPKNSSDKISYDNVLTSRKFQAVIYQEENIYDNRPITDYIKDNSFLQLLEASRIKKSIRDREEDAWNY